VSRPGLVKSRTSHAHGPEGVLRGASRAPGAGIGPSAYPRDARASLIDGLLGADPALRWQVERGLLHAPAETWVATRARVATEGFGAPLLAPQDADGRRRSR